MPFPSRIRRAFRFASVACTRASPLISISGTALAVVQDAESLFLECRSAFRLQPSATVLRESDSVPLIS